MGGAVILKLETQAAKCLFSFFFPLQCRAAKRVITTQSEPVRSYWFLLSAGFTGHSRFLCAGEMQSSMKSSELGMFEYSTSFWVDFAALKIDGKAILVKVFNEFPLTSITLTEWRKAMCWKEASELQLWETTRMIPVCTFSISWLLESCGSEDPRDF